MDKKKLRQCAEGLIVTAAGLGYVLLSLGIRRNPVKTDGFWGLLTEANSCRCCCLPCSPCKACV